MARNDSTSTPDRSKDRPLIHRRRMFYLPGVAKSLDGLWLAAAAARSLAEAGGQKRYDLIDSHFGYPEGVGCVKAALKLDIPVFITMRGLERQILKSPGRGRQLLWALERCQGVICVAHALRTLAMKAGIPSEKIEVIPNAVDRRTFYAGDRSYARRVLGIDEKCRLIACVGMLVAGKGQHHLVESVAKLRDRDSRWRLVLLGGTAHDSSYPAFLQARVRELRLESHVILAGPQPPKIIALWLRASDIFSLITQDEGCCNAVLEAMACGLPVVTTPVGDNELLVDPPTRGFMVPLEGLYGLPATLNAAVETAWDRESIAQYGADYTWEEAGRRTLSFFKSRLRDGDTARVSTELQPAKG